MTELKFTLSHDRKYYRDLFHHEDFNFFSNNTKLKKALHILFACIIFTLIVRVVPSLSWLVPFGVIGILGGAALSCEVLFKFGIWKLYVNKYSRQLSTHETTTLSVNEKGVLVNTGKSEDMYKWDHFDATKISDDYIVLTNMETTSVVIPSECLPKHEFKALNKAIRKHLQK